MKLNIGRKFYAADGGGGSAGGAAGEGAQGGGENEGGAAGEGAQGGESGGEAGERGAQGADSGRAGENGGESGAKYTQADIEAATAKAVEEALKKAKMKPDEQAEYDRAQREAALAEREGRLAEKELRLEAAAMLGKKQLDGNLLDYVIGKDAADTAKRIDAFKSVFDKAVQAQVETRLAGNTPPAGGGTGGGSPGVREIFRAGLTF